MTEMVIWRKASLNHFAYVQNYLRKEYVILVRELEVWMHEWSTNSNLEIMDFVVCIHENKDVPDAI